MGTSGQILMVGRYKYGSQEPSTHTVTALPLLNCSNIFQSPPVEVSIQYSVEGGIKEGQACSCTSFPLDFPLLDFLFLHSMFSNGRLFAAMRQSFCIWVKRSPGQMVKHCTIRNEKFSKVEPTCCYNQSIE